MAVKATTGGREEVAGPAADGEVSLAGTNLTFGAGELTVQACALDREDLDLDGAHAAIDFTARLGGTDRFGSVEALVRQLHEDVNQPRVLPRANR